jgi:hypothetical protein
LIQGKYLRKKKIYVSFNVTNKIIKCLLFALNIVCTILFYKAGNFIPEMFSVTILNKRPTAGNINSPMLPPSQKTS